LEPRYIGSMGGKGWTFQTLIDAKMTVRAFCHHAPCNRSQLLDLAKLHDRFGPDAPAMTDDITPKLKCTKCDGRPRRTDLQAEQHSEWLRPGQGQLVDHVSQGLLACPRPVLLGEVVDRVWKVVARDGYTDDVLSTRLRAVAVTATLSQCLFPAPLMRFWSGRRLSQAVANLMKTAGTNPGAAPLLC